MSPSTKGPGGEDRNSLALAAEETLRMVAMLPAPEGLEDRVKVRLRTAPRQARVIAWPFAPAQGWMRGAAAAAIVLAVAGGGWGVYSHIQVAPVPAAIEQQMPNGVGAFSTAGAKHVPQTVEGPVVAAPVVEKEKAAKDRSVPQKHTDPKAKGHTAPGVADQQRPVR